MRQLLERDIPYQGSLLSFLTTPSSIGQFRISVSTEEASVDFHTLIPILKSDTRELVPDKFELIDETNDKQSRVATTSQHLDIMLDQTPNCHGVDENSIALVDSKACTMQVFPVSRQFADL